MKKTYLLIAVLLNVFSLMLISCDKDDDTKEDRVATNYAELTYDDILTKEGTLSGNAIIATNDNGLVLNVGDVVIYKTNSNRFGKLEILAFDEADNYKLTIKAVTYNSDKTIFSETTSLEIRGTWICSLDAMEEDSANGDFHWYRLNATNSSIVPLDEALIAKYNF